MFGKIIAFLYLFIYNVKYNFTNLVTFDPHSIPGRKARRKILSDVLKKSC